MSEYGAVKRGKLKLKGAAGLEQRKKKKTKRKREDRPREGADLRHGIRCEGGLVPVLVRTTINYRVEGTLLLYNLWYNPTPQDVGVRCNALRTSVRRPFLRRSQEAMC